MPTLATFNANNFFLRYRFSRTYPGDERHRASLIEASEVATIGYLPGLHFGRYAANRYIVWDQARRELAFDALRAPENQLPDILCLQEVENIHAIRILNDRYFGGYYDHSLLIDAYDPRNIDVGVLSRYPIKHIRSHIDDEHDNNRQLFRSRDCLEVDIELPGEDLTLYINHLKSKYVDTSGNPTPQELRNRILRGHQKRLAQAQAIYDLIDRRFRGQHTTALYAVVGDLNDTPESPWMAPLMTTPRLTNVLQEQLGPDDHWTYYWRSRNRVSQIDYVLASRALTARIETQSQNPARRPHIERSGLAYRELNANGEVLPRESNLVHFEPDEATPANPNTTPSSRVPFRFRRDASVMANWRNNLSDHCPVKVWF